MSALSRYVSSVFSRLLFADEQLLKNLPLAPLAPPPKLGRVPSSFAIGGAFVKTILPPFRPLRPFCPRRDRLRDARRRSPLSDSGRVCYRFENS